MRFLPLILGASAELLQDLKNLFPGGGAASPTLDTKMPEEKVDPVQELASMDLLCMSGEHAQGWFNIQQKLRYILGPDAAFNPLHQQHQLEAVLYSVMEDMQGISARPEDHCGIGKLAVQLLSILTMDGGEGLAVRDQILNNEQLTSPLLTLLLDIPWNSYQPMWPLFGVYAQMAMRRVQAGTNNEAVDGLVFPELQQFAAALNMGIVNGDLQGLKELSRAYLEAGAEAAESAPLGFLTAIFTQGAVADTKEEAQVLFYEAQNLLKQMVQSPQDLDTLMSTKWPLWGMAYLHSLRTAA